MNEQEVRALVREAIERHLARPGSATNVAPHDSLTNVAPRDTLATVAPYESLLHPSHVILKVLPGSQIDDGMCVIEPAVRCNHCGYCQSYGH